MRQTFRSFGSLSVFIGLLCHFAFLNASNASPQIGLISADNQSNTDWCRQGWDINSNRTKCFKLIPKLLQWNESELECIRFGGHLAVIESPQDTSYAERLCHKRTSGCWIGGTVTNYTTGLTWKWSDNTSDWNTSLFESLERNKSENSCSLVTNDSKISSWKCDTPHEFICMLDTENKCFHMRCHREYIIVLAVVSGLILFITLAVVIWLLDIKRSKKRRKFRKLPTLAATSSVPARKVFTKEELKSITKNFSEGNRLLGDAKTGGTYSGLLSDGSKVAVKRLRRSSLQKKEEFYSEIGRIAKLHHPNLVSIKGWCYDHGERFIVYEFVGNGLLDRWLHHVPRGARCLDWPMRMKIATTVAQGIAFLHDKVKPQVVHRDIRASNVLLDEEFGAHLMGVGLSKFVPWEVMQERTLMTGGTHGYLAPEYVYRNEMTTRSDVYSFGVLLLEIISGRKPAQAVDSVGWQSIFEWATPLVQAHSYLALLDPVISSNVPEVGDVQKVVDLVYACTQHVPSSRPRMTHVVHQLQQLTNPVGNR